ncbi:hypothetical protein BDW66DRAFT_113094 [Aspergillus desertorum]
MNPPAFFLFSTATPQTTKPNTRIPPILAAGKASNLNPATFTTTTAEPPSSRLTTLSKQKLSAEAATGDPDLRRCLGHQCLFARSLHKAKEDMKRYLEEVLESESDNDDEEDLYGEYDFGKGEVLFQEDEIADDEDDESEECKDECPTLEEADVVVPPPATPVAAATVSKAQSPVPVLAPAPALPPAPAPGSMACSNCTSTSTPGPVWIRDKLAGAVRGLVKRRNLTSPPPPPDTSPPAPPPFTTSPPPAAAALSKEPQSTLTRIAAKNASCSQIPVYIHVQEQLSKPARTLERSQSESQLQSRSQGHGRAITTRGRQYAQRLGLKVAAAVPVTT